MVVTRRFFFVTRRFREDLYKGKKLIERNNLPLITNARRWQGLEYCKQLIPIEHYIQNKMRAKHQNNKYKESALMSI